MEERDIFDRYLKREIDISFNNEPERYSTPANIFKTVQEAFNNGKEKEMEIFLRKLDILAKDAVDYLGQSNYGELRNKKDIMENIERSNESGVVNGQYMRGYNFKDVDGLSTDSLNDLISNRGFVPRINFRNISHVINNMHPYELYGILNSSSEDFDRKRIERIVSYTTIKEQYDKREEEIKNLEILALQKFFNRGVIVFNQNMVEEIVHDMVRFGAGRTLKAYISPLVILPRRLLFGPGSFYDMAKMMIRIRENSRLYNIIGDEKDFKFEYSQFEKILEREFYHTDLDAIKEKGKKRRNIKTRLLENYFSAVSFNSRDYMKEYQELRPYLKHYNLRKMSRNQLRNFYGDIEIHLSELEYRIGRGLSDISKKLIRNQSVINNIIERHLINKPYIEIDDISSEWFGLKIPLEENGKIDNVLLDFVFEVIPANSRENLKNEARKAKKLL